MTDVLLDTHVALWWLDDQPLSRVAHDAIADPTRAVHVSLASLWELAIKHSVGRFRLRDDLDQVLVDNGIELLAMTAAHALAVRDLPLHHRDPFDRMLVAQALVEGLTLVTRDRRLAEYGVRVMAA
ncbi:MAG: type II toxin-antitoxin system VapC family toxin [Actinomycetota bacterium]|nr:type II toxin-antitoxin system VapC family toxin [Actinomycetota bacterium]